MKACSKKNFDGFTPEGYLGCMLHRRFDLLASVYIYVEGLFGQPSLLVRSSHLFVGQFFYHKTVGEFPIALKLKERELRTSRRHTYNRGEQKERKKNNLVT